MTIPPYVEHIRKKIGTDLLLLPSVSIIPRDDAGRLLLVKHSYTGVWGLVGGTIDVDELPEDAAHRETKEEVDLEVSLELVGVVGGPEYQITYPNGDNGAFVIAVYDARITGGEPKPDGDEVTDVAWFEPSALKDLEMNSNGYATLRDLGYFDA